MNNEKDKNLGSVARGIEHLFGSVTRTRLLRTFLNNFERPFFMRELSRKINVQLNAVRRELDNLEKFGLVKSYGNSHKKYYSLNGENIIFPELKALLSKSQFILESNLARDIDAAGSIHLLVLSDKFVGYTETGTDLLLVGRLNRAVLEKIIEKLQTEVGFEINYTVMTRKEYDYRIEVGDKFLYNIVESKKITLIDRV